MVTESATTAPPKRKLHLRLALRLVWSHARGWTVLNAGMLLVTGLLPLASLYVMKQIVDSAAQSITATDKRAAFYQVGLWIAAAGSVSLVSLVCRSIADLAREAQGFAVTDGVYDLLHAKSIGLDLEYYEHAQYYDMLFHAQQEAPYRPTRILNGLLQLAQSCVSLAGIGVLLFSFSWLMALILVVAAVPGAIVRFVHSKKLYALRQQQTQREREASYYHGMITDRWHAKEIRLFNLGDLFRGRFFDLRRNIREARLKLSRRRTVVSFFAQSTTIVATFVTLGLICFKTSLGTVTIGALVMYYQAFQTGLGHFSNILGGIAGLYEDDLFLTSFYQFMELAPKTEVTAKPRPVPERARQQIVFDGISFTYPHGSRQVLQDIRLTLDPGQVIALVGQNGSGKTTLIKLLCRLYDPTNGRITVDGVDIRDLDPVQWRRQIGVVFQDYCRYQLTAWENIWLGDVDSTPDRERIRRAASLAGADPAIERLAEGYDSVLGNRFSGGRELSVGEWQKMALARAFLRDSGIVVLDEPTSSMDALAEAHLFERFGHLIDGRSAILISHRFSTVRMADHIYVLEKGHIAEQGSHDDLVRLDGLYARMYRAQTRLYGGVPSE
jgi:ATP-binding cassette, subfamily B, bacterial